MNTTEALVNAAKIAGAAGKNWDEWTFSDEVQNAVLYGDSIDVDKVQEAFSEGAKEWKSKNWRVAWTTAPIDYDTGRTETLEVSEFRLEALRKVAIDPDPANYHYQTARYALALYPVWDEDPRVIEARLQSERENASQRERKREEGLTWLRTATDDDLRNPSILDSHGVSRSDAKAEIERRKAVDWEKARVEAWNRCAAVVPEGCILIDPGSRPIYSKSIIRDWSRPIPEALASIRKGQ